MLGGRYRLIAPVGVGTSSRVYLAVDTQLRRRVAVKLLHEALAEDEAFLRRFRAEARAAGALSHPSIVAVFDWGEDHVDGVVVPYLVTEYLGGGSLRGILDTGVPLSPAQTLVVGLDATRALAHAHQRGLVHRDVKPANLLFDDDRRLRLADFGLARALAEASWTEPTGTAVGTARYASPEQALGRRLDGRSDVYSLALVLVECVTGSVPFSADTTAATLALRTQGDLELGAELGGLRSVLERAARLDPDERPEAAEFEIALMAAAEEYDRPDPLPIVATMGDGEQTSQWLVVDGESGITLVDPVDSVDPVDPVDPVDADASAVGQSEAVDGTRTAGGPTRSPITVAEEHDLLAASRPASFGPVEPLEAPATLVAGMAELGTGTPVMRADRSRRKDHKSNDRKSSDHTNSDHRSDAPRGRRMRTSVVAAVLIAVAAGVLGWWFLVRVPVHDVPNFVGDDVLEATGQAESLGWVVDDSTEDRRDGTEPGEVLAQDPPVGEPLAEGEVLRLTISLGSTLAPLPDVVGVPQAEAEAALTQAGFVVGDVTRTHDEQLDEGLLKSVTPVEGSEAIDSQGRLPKGTSLSLVVSEGPAPRAVPAGLQGAKATDAAAALDAVQLTPRQNASFSEDVPEGYVISVSQSPGTELARGTDVVLEVSKGPAPITVPDVRYNSGSVAAAMLEDAGFTVSGIEGSPSGMVLATDPPAGEQHKRGTAVRIFTRS